MSRQKTFFTSNELPHIWAHQRAPEGRCPTAETFRGKTYYSYATPIARLVIGKSKEAGVIINSTSYSITTSRHLVGVRQAVGHIFNKFYVDSIEMGREWALPCDGKTLRDHYLRQFEEVCEKSRYAHVNAQSFLRRLSNLDCAIRTCQFFGIKCKALINKVEKLEPKRVEAELVIAAREDRKKQLQRGRERTKRDAAIEHARAWLVKEEGESRPWTNVYLLDEFPELVAQIEAKNARILAREVEEWKAGGSNIPYGAPVALRREGEEIVTSIGARFPYEHGEKAFRFVNACRINRRSYRNNGHSVRVGHYTIDSIEPDGSLVAGCHHISWGEIADFASRQKWNFIPRGQNQPANPEGVADEGLQPAAT